METHVILGKTLIYSLKSKMSSKQDKTNSKPKSVVVPKVKDNTSLLECHICKKKYQRQNALDFHIKSHSLIDLKRYRCKICKKQCADEVEYKMHRKTHTIEKPHQCSMCGTAFTTKRNLEIHILKHDGKFQYECVPCNKRFYMKIHYNHHMCQNHSDERPFKCEFCPKAFSLKKYLRMHFNKCHGPNKPKLKIRTCVACQKIFKEKNKYDAHMFRMHNGPQPIYSTSTRPDEKAEPNKIINCKHCDQKFLNPLSLKYHMSKSHSDERTHQCTMCISSFTTEKYLQIHMDAVHLKNRPHACDVRIIISLYNTLHFINTNDM